MQHSVPLPLLLFHCLVKAACHLSCGDRFPLRYLTTCLAKPLLIEITYWLISFLSLIREEIQWLGSFMLEGFDEPCSPAHCIPLSSVLTSGLFLLCFAELMLMFVFVYFRMSVTVFAGFYSNFILFFRFESCTVKHIALSCNKCFLLLTEMHRLVNKLSRFAFRRDRFSMHRLLIYHSTGSGTLPQMQKYHN